MTSIQERLQIKREPLDKWSVREKLCLAVARNSDQNMTSVSRALKPFGEPNRPADWFHQKNCAAQYGALLANVETPKRKKRTTGGDSVIETPAESVLRRLLHERKGELKRLLAEEKAEYRKLQEDMEVLQSGNVSEEQLDKWCREIDEEESRKEQEALAHAQWLREREQRKQEMERAWRPVKPPPLTIGQKRKNSESMDGLVVDGSESLEGRATPPAQEHPKPALSPSPLLTSLLKSPSQIINQVSTSSILHSAITNQRVIGTTTTSPMIASLLSSSPGVTGVSPGLQQLVSSAIGQESLGDAGDSSSMQSIPNDILDDASLPNLKIDDLTSSMLVPDDGQELPEMKNDVDVIISDLIDSAQDIVADPEQHLQLDGNGDLSLNLDIDDLDEETEPMDVKAEEKTPEKTPIVVDPFEFQEDPEVFEMAKTPLSKPLLSSSSSSDLGSKFSPFHQHTLQDLPNLLADERKDASMMAETKSSTNLDYPAQERGRTREEYLPHSHSHPHSEIQQYPKKERGAALPGSVEIVEVPMMGGDDIDKVLNKSQIEDIVHKSERPEPPRQQQQQQHEQQHEQQQKETWEDVVKKSEDITYSSIVSSATSSATSTSSVTVTAASASTSTANTLSEELKMTPAENVEMTTEVDVKEEEPVPVALEIPTSTPQETGPAGPSHHYSEELYDDANMEVKVDKSGKAKRDYSRTKKKDEKEFDMLLAIEKAQQDDNDLAEESFSDREYYGSEVEMKERNKEVKTPRGMGKSENERSSSPWTEEEDVTSVRHARRRLSTPATPNDSVPNSPVSSIYYNDEDRDYRNWKKAVMLVYSRVAANKYASLFSKPITDDQAPGYHSVVYRPMDLLTMRKHIENGTIRTTQEFQRDVLLMFNNAIMYNKTNGTVYNMARQMQQESLQQIQLFLQAQSQVDTPARRETRTSEPGLKRKRPAEDTNPNRSKKRKED